MNNPKNETDVSGYKYTGGMRACHMHRALLPEIEKHLPQGNPKPCLFDLGCGNGSTADYFLRKGYDLIGVDPSNDGIRIARNHLPEARLEIGSCYEDLASKYGKFPFLISLEVVEHVFFPRKFAKCAFDLLENGGTAFISTPYHGYLKNLALAASGKMDKHFTALWDFGHIKFWSRKTLEKLLIEAGFKKVSFIRVGRIPPIAKSMLAIAQK